MITEKQQRIMIHDLANFSNRALNRFSSAISHYCSPSVIEKILLNDRIQLRFTRSDCMNDSSEGNHALTLFRLAIDECYLTNEITRKYHDYLYQVESYALAAFNRKDESSPFRSLYKEFCQDNCYYLCCFSADNDSLPLWNYYVKDKNYEGFSIQLDSNKIEKAKFRNDVNEIWVSSVIYYDFYDSCIKLIKRHKGYFRRANILELETLSYMFSCFLEKYKLIVKNNCFRHEIEVRAILRLKANEIKQEQYDWSHGFPRPYIEIDFEKEAFRSIMVGPLLEKEISRNNTESFLLSRGYPWENRVRNSGVPIRF